MAAKKKSTGKKPVSDVASRRYKTVQSYDMYGGGNFTQLYDRLTGGDRDIIRTGKKPLVQTPRSGASTYYMDKKTATNVKQRTRKSVSPKRRSK